MTDEFLSEALAYARVIVREADAGRFDAPKSEMLARALLWLYEPGRMGARYELLTEIAKRLDPAYSETSSQGVELVIQAAVERLVAQGHDFAQRYHRGMHYWDQEKKRSEALRAERDSARERLDRCVSVLTRIHSFLNPPDVTVEGKTYRFDNAAIQLEAHRALSEAIRAIPEEMRQGASSEADAARWRALLGCKRIRVLGYARGGPQGKDGPIRHIGFEFTSDQEPYCDLELQDGKGRLVEFVDACLSALNQSPPREKSP